METIKLKLFEILSLKEEIQGAQDQEGHSVTKGLLKQELPYFVKFLLHDLNGKINSEHALINKIREELIIKYGETSANGNTEILVSIEAIVEEDGIKKYKLNPKFIEFQEEYNIFLRGEKEIEYTPFDLEDLKSMVTSEDYPIFRKFVKDVQKD